MLITCLRSPASLRCSPRHLSRALSRSSSIDTAVAHHRQQRQAGPASSSRRAACSAMESSSGLEAAPAAAAPSSAGSGNGGEAEVVLQYIVLRRDLWGELGWPLGSVVAQGCHAATAALWLSRESAITQRYCSPENLDHMHKVVLEVKGEAQLRGLAEKLTEAGVAHKLWVEQPEDFATCLATAPAPKSAVQPLVKRLKLCKGAV